MDHRVETAEIVCGDVADVLVDRRIPARGGSRVQARK